LTGFILSAIIDFEIQFQRRGINMEDIFGIFIDFLKKKGLKLTRQREKILNAFLIARRHLSVEELYDIVKKKDPNIGQATVFRTLKLLCEADIAKEVELGGKILRYELKYGHQHHDHLVCIKCGESIEALDPEIEKLQNRLCKKFRFLPKRHRLEIFGICRRCRQKES
jgi:Fur family ferric uptake transcriptional regulator